MRTLIAGFVCGCSFLSWAGCAERTRCCEPAVSFGVTDSPSISPAPVEGEVFHEARFEARRRKVEGDIEELRVVNPACTPHLCIEYEVEVEDACPGDVFELRVQVRHRDNLLWEAVVLLDQPNEIDDDEWTFEGSFTGQMAGVVVDGRRLRAEATLVHLGSGRRLDRESERVRDRGGCVFVGEQERVLPNGPMLEGVPFEIVPEPPSAPPDGQPQPEDEAGSPEG